MWGKNNLRNEFPRGPPLTIIFTVNRIIVKSILLS